MKQRIPIQDLRPGMYISSLDQSWFKTPFLRHQWTVKREDEITLLRSYGIQEVVIDTLKGDGLESAETGPSPTVEPIGSSDADPPNSGPTIGPDPKDIESARLLRAEAISTLDLFFQQMESSDDVAIQEVRGVVSTLLDGILEHQPAMVALIQMRRFDPNLASHGVDTGVLAMAMGQEHSCSPSELKLLGLAALLHDIGQLRLPLNLVCKVERYTPQDYQVMKAHAQMGVSILKQWPQIPADIFPLVLHHHERLDGSGYPDGLVGEQISELTQIISIADTYDAQISGRCSYPPVPPSQALSELYQAAIKGQYQPLLVQRLIQMLGVYPIGSLVRLNTDELAVVVWVQSHFRLTPTIKLLKDPSGQDYRDQEIIDLSSQLDEPNSRTIVEVLDPHNTDVDPAQILESLW